MCDENDSRSTTAIAAVVVVVFPPDKNTEYIGFNVGNWSININYRIYLFILSEWVSVWVGLCECAYMYDVNLQNKHTKHLKYPTRSYTHRTTHLW